MTAESLTPGSGGVESGTVPSERVRGPEILATTMDLVREQGLCNVRVSDVAERAGTSPTSVIYYFGSKGQLFQQAVITADAEFYARVRLELAALDSGIDQLACLVVRFRASEWPLWVDTWLFAREHRELREVERDVEQRWCALIADIVRAGQQREEFAPIDAESFAIRLSAVSEGLALHIVLGQPGRSPGHYVETILTMVAAELGCSLDRLRQAVAAVPAQPGQDKRVSAPVVNYREGGSSAIHSRAPRGRGRLHNPPEGGQRFDELDHTPGFTGETTRDEGWS